MTDVAESVPERFVPAQMRGQLVEAEHLVRYWWAAQLASGRRVLDAGCGLGYGAALLHEAGARHVEGVDVSGATIEAARAAVPAEIALSEADVTALPHPDDAFDLVVCFETIEHLERPAAALDELARVLAPGGVLAISSPNRREYPPDNPHHAHEYAPEELIAELGARFRTVEPFRQQAWTASAILADADFRAAGLDAPLELTSAKVTGREPGRETYTLVLAGDGPLPALPGRAVLTGAVELRRWLKLYDEMQATLERQLELLNGRDRAPELDAAHRRLREAERELGELTALRQRERDWTRDRDALDARVRALTAELEAARAAHADTRALLARADAVMRAMKASASWRLTAPLRALKRLSS